MNSSGKLVFPPTVPSKRVLLSNNHPLPVGESVRKSVQAGTLGTTYVQRTEIDKANSAIDGDVAASVS